MSKFRNAFEQSLRRGVLEAVMAGRTIREMIEDPLSNEDFVGTKAENNKSLVRWSELKSVAVERFSKFRSHPNRVWYCAVPEETRARYDEQFNEHFSDDPHYQAADVFMVIYESTEAARRFRLATEGALRPIVVDQIAVDCPFEYDFFVSVKERETAPAPDIKG